MKTVIRVTSVCCHTDLMAPYTGANCIRSDLSFFFVHTRHRIGVGSFTHRAQKKHTLYLTDVDVTALWLCKAGAHIVSKSYTHDVHMIYRYWHWNPAKMYDIVPVYGGYRLCARSDLSYCTLANQMILLIKVPYSANNIQYDKSGFSSYFDVC